MSLWYCPPNCKLSLVVMMLISLHTVSKTSSLIVMMVIPLSHNVQKVITDCNDGDTIILEGPKSHH